MVDGFRLFFNNGWRHHDIAAILDFVRHLTIWVFCFEGKIMELDFANTYIHQIIVIVSTHNALLFEIKSTLFCVNVVALPWAAWIIICIILTCYRWWYLLLVLLVLRPSISSLLQSATSGTTLQLYRPFERTLVHTLCLADVNLQTWSLRHMLWFIDHFKNWVSADQCHKYDCI